MDILNVLFTGLVVVLIVLLFSIVVVKLCAVFCDWMSIESMNVRSILLVMFALIYAKLLAVLGPHLYVLLL